MLLRERVCLHQNINGKNSNISHDHQTLVINETDHCMILSAHHYNHDKPDLPVSLDPKDMSNATHFSHTYYATIARPFGFLHAGITNSLRFLPKVSTYESTHAYG